MEMWIGTAMFTGLIAALLLGIPVAYSLLLVAISTLVLTGGGLPAIDLIASTAWGSVATFTLTAVPVFILMGAIISVSGMGSRLYSALSTILHGVPGGLAVATTLACTIMAATSGSSVATAAAIGGFSIKEMRRFGYRDSDACGAVAAGGTLGILIPPSIPMIVYGIIAGQSIGKLFIAGIMPGILMAFSFATYQVWLAMRRRAQGGIREDDRRVTPRDRLRALVQLLPTAILIWIILGSMYTGFATPTESAALGTIASLAISGAVYRELTWAKLLEILRATARGSVMVLAIIAAAMVFGYVMTSTQVAAAISQAVAASSLPPWALFISINVLLIFLGCFMETLSIIVVTMPILIPIISALGWDLIWFGIILTINMEMALIHPPVGLNLFVVHAVAPDVRLVRIVLGALPYVFIMAAVLALVAIYPSIATGLLPAARAR
ncbi:MAG TPA: TRAP transporter large permease subunit [Usitatibacter sp.]|nr:TRAP transporter large permease subunit [Usitatibacter sp.]